MWIFRMCKVLNITNLCWNPRGWLNWHEQVTGTNLIRLLHKQRRQKQPEFISSCSTLHVWLGRDNTELNPLRIIISKWERMASILTGLYSNTCFHLLYMNTYVYCKWMHRNATEFQVWKRLMLRFSWLRIPNKENPKTRETHKFFFFKYMVCDPSARVRFTPSSQSQNCKLERKQEPCNNNSVPLMLLSAFSCSQF